ncbi:MAG: hypothetical protein MAG794_00722 [Gammaproteobacteria bacterium]|nr:hypothetical protein [Gammaproteobacteria bacterium]
MVEAALFYEGRARGLGVEFLVTPGDRRSAARSWRHLSSDVRFLPVKKKDDMIVNANTSEGQRTGEAIIEAVENQLRENDPPEVKRTLERLMGMGETRENAMRYIACALSVEIYEAMKSEPPYDEERYTRNLKKLPELPDEWDKKI